MSKFTKWVLSILLVILISVWAAIVEAPDKNFHISALNVGQGDSILVQTPNGKNILIDGGPDNKVLEELGSKIPFYNHKLEAVVLTHPHADHLFGLIEVLKRYEVGSVYLTGVNHITNEYITLLELLKSKEIPTSKVKAGDAVKIDEVEFSVLWPKADLSGQTVDNLNNSSIVLKVNYKNFSALLLGDSENSAQEELLNGSSLSQANLIKIAHHGSSGSFYEPLIDQVKPSLAVISVGADNDYGHPSASTISGLEKRGVTIKRTDRDGTISITSDGDKFW